MFWFPEIAYVAAMHAAYELEAKRKEEGRLKSLTNEELDRELKIRTVKALEEIVRKNPTINVRSSIF